MKKTWMKWIGFLILLICIGLYFTTNYFYNEAVKRGVEVELYRGESEQSVEVSNYPKGESKLVEARNWYAQQHLKEETQISYDGLTLHATYLQNKNREKKAVILAHGYRSNGESMKDYVKFYYEQGFDVLMPDARGHGRSEGDYVGYGWHDRIDYLHWMNILIHKYNIEDIILHGNSMGAATVLMVSGEKLPDEVKGIVADSSYTSVKDELTHQLTHLYQLPAFPILHFTSLMTNFRSGYTFEEASALKQVKNNTRPLFIIHGAKDELVPTEMASKLYEAAGGDKELWIVPNAGHTDAYEIAPVEYEERLLNFINKLVFAKR